MIRTLEGLVHEGDIDTLSRELHLGFAVLLLLDPRGEARVAGKLSFIRLPKNRSVVVS